MTFPRTEYVTIAVPLALTPSLMLEALRAISCEALAGATRPSATASAQGTTRRSNNQPHSRFPSEAELPLGMPGSRDLRRLGSEPLGVDALDGHRRFAGEAQEHLDHRGVELGAGAFDAERRERLVLPRRLR